MMSENFVKSFEDLSLTDLLQIKDLFEEELRKNQSADPYIGSGALLNP
jgi:hypothetical protein